MAKRGPWRWSVVAVVFLLSLSAMVAAQRWYEGHRAVPLLAQVEVLPGVRWARVGDGPAGRTLWVGVEPVEDVTGLVGALRRAAAAGGPGSLREIVLVDNRDEALSRALARFQLALQEGAFSGAFLRMQEHITRQAAEMGVDQARVFVDGQAVYLLLVEGSRYLYEVVPRPVPLPGGGPAVAVRAEGPSGLAPIGSGAAEAAFGPGDGR